MLTAEQAWAIGHLVHALRADWTAEQVVHHLKRLEKRNPFDVAMAALRAAADPEAKYPAIIPGTGSHWSERLSEPEAPRPPRRDESCLDCGRHLDGCACGNQRRRPIETSPLAAQHLQGLRGQLAIAREAMCACGVVAKSCRDHREATAEETP